MAETFEVALSSDFRLPDGSPAYPSFDLGPLETDPTVRLRYVDPVDGVMPGEALENVDALILLIPRFDARSVPKSGRLAVVARFGVGYDTVNVDDCTNAGIALVITPDGVRRPVAVSILTFMLALTGKLMIKDRLTREAAAGYAKRAGHMGVGLVGRTLGSLGIGNIGAELFRLAKPFDMQHIAHDPYADKAVAAELGIELVGLEDLFRRADILSVNCPLTPETRHIVNAERLALMKPTACLINTARGPIVDQAALTEALQAGRIAGAGLDVFEDEPSDAADPLFGLENVIVTPHSLCWTDQCFADIGAADVRAVQALVEGKVPEGIVNRDITSNDRWRAKLETYRVRL
jgi:D-3-phosphoglycerate dehydrogenase